MKRAACLLLVALTFACGSKAPEGPPIGVTTKAGSPLPTVGKPTTYVFDPLDERPVSSDAHRGKPTVLVFVTTGDIVGQAQVSYLVHMARHDSDRVNYALVALHPRKEIVLVEAYLKTLGVDFPVALGEPNVTTPGGPFGDIPAVPTTVILDRENRVVWKHTGLAKSDELRAHMRGL